METFRSNLVSVFNRLLHIKKRLLKCRNRFKQSSKCPILHVPVYYTSSTSSVFIFFQD